MNEIFVGDAAEVLKTFESESIDLTVTSPPYDKLRDYKQYFFDFENIASQLFRITKKGGVVVWVVKDATIKGNKTLTSFRQALFFQSVGFNVYDIIIYSKTGGSLPHKRRYRDAWEFMFIFSKGTPKTVNLICDRKNKYGGTMSYGNVTVREKDGILGKRQQRRVSEIGCRYNIWEYATGNGNSTRDKVAFGHPAIFPEKLAKDHILSWSNIGDVVLDPMCGSGTTLKMAKETGRNYVGIDISPEYIEIAKLRLGTS